MVSFILASISSLASATLVSALLHPRPQITSAPTFRPDHALLRRQGGFGEQVTSSIAVTCGFIDAYILSPLGCYQGSVCAQDLTANVAGACCRLGDVSAGNCQPATKCIGLVDLPGQCGGDCSADDRVVKCSEFASRYCYTRYWPLDGQTPIQVGCTDTADHSDYAYRSYTGYGDGGFTATAVDVSAARAQVTSAARSSSVSATSPISQSTAGRTDSQNGGRASEPSESKGGSGPPAGIIAGGLIGGLAVLGIIAALIVWLVLRNRRKAKAASSRQVASSPPTNGAATQSLQTEKPNELPSTTYAHGATELSHDGSYRPNEVYSNENGYAHEIHGRRVVGELP